MIAFVVMDASMALGHLALPGGSVLRSMVSPIWPATGVSIALVLLWGWRVLPAVFAASMLPNRREFGAVRETLLAPAGDTVEPLLAWMLLRWTKTAMPPLCRAPDVARFIALGALAAPVVGALVGLSLLRAAEFVADAHDARVWLTWSDLRGSAEFAFPARGACHRLKVDLSEMDVAADDDESTLPRRALRRCSGRRRRGGCC